LDGPASVRLVKRSLNLSVTAKAPQTASSQLTSTVRVRDLPILPRWARWGVPRFVTHHFTLDEFDAAYDMFGRAADTGALKVVLSRTA
jgi:alcohol dehydrogenase